MARTLTALLFALALLAAGCGNDDPSVTAAQEGRPVIVTALRPLAEAVERMAGDAVVVIDLVPVGESAHELELTDRQRDEVLDADLTIVLGNGFQPALERLAGQRDGETLDVLATLRLPDRPDGSTGPPDPHIWLDPTIMGSVVTAISHSLARVVPEIATDLNARSQEIVEQNVRLDAQLTQGLAECERTVIAFQHEAFGWFAARYGMTAVGFDDVIPDDDPASDPVREAAIGDRIDAGEVATLFLDALSQTSWLEVIADERGLDTDGLDTYEGLTLAAATANRTYRSTMLANLEVLQRQLDCSTT